MGLFGARKSSAIVSRTAVKLSSGRRFRSELGLDASIEAVHATVTSYTEQRYEVTWPLCDPGYEWLGSASAPDAVVGADDVDGHFALVAFWDDDRGTEAGFFPLGSGDERLNGIRFPALWKLNDMSLSSTGLFPAGLFSLRAPVLIDGYFSEVLEYANLPINTHNLHLVETQVAQMFVLKGSEFLRGDDPDLAEQFVQENKMSTPQEVLDAIARHDVALTPYIQYLPNQVRSIMIEAEFRDPTGTFWREAHR